MIIDGRLLPLASFLGMSKISDPLVICNFLKKKLY